MKKLVFTIGAAILFASCGNGDETPATTTETSTTTTTTKETPAKTTEAPEEVTSGKLLTNQSALQKAEDALKALPQFSGKDVNVFQTVHFYDDGRIVIELQDPNKPQNVDHYEYKDGKWAEPQPVQISGGGDMKANTTPLNDIKFATVATIAKNYLEKSATVEGAKQEITHVYFSLFVPNQKRSWRAGSIDGSREKYDIEFNMDGSVKEFKKNGH